MSEVPPWLRSNRTRRRNNASSTIATTSDNVLDLQNMQEGIVVADTDPELEDCSVCYDVLVGSDQPLRLLDCGHTFHHACIQQWLCKRLFCPMCKRPAVPAADSTTKMPASLDIVIEGAADQMYETPEAAEVSVDILDRIVADAVGGGALVDCRFRLSVGVNEVIAPSRLLLLRQQIYGLVGRNGAGKSLLLSQLFFQGFPIAENMRVALVAQEELPSAETVLERILSGDTQRMKLLAELQSLEAVLDPSVDVLARLGEVMEELTAIGAYEAEDRATSIACNLGFTKRQLHQPIRELSGGWRMRASLARALFAEPELLLLDEATNHLDLETILWLQRWLGECSATVIVVSHDARFLDAVIDHVLYLGPDGLHTERGDYSTFERNAEQQRVAHEHRLEKRRVNEDRMRKSIEESTRRAKVSGDDNAARSAKTRLEKKLHRIGLYRSDGRSYKLNSLRQLHEKWARLPERVEALQNDAKLRFKFPSSDTMPGMHDELLRLQDADFAFRRVGSSGNLGREDMVLQHVTLRITGSTRAAIVGRNGVGKSTLLRLLADDIQACRGESRTQKPHAVIAYMSQHHLEALEDFLELTPVQYLRLRKGILLRNDREARQYLGRFGLPGRMALTRIGSLSGGLRTRLAVAEALLLPTPATFLLLDEPTNHLDFESIEALALALELFQGAVIVVSHNLSFLATVCDELWVVRDGSVEVSHSTEGGDGFAELFQRYTTTVDKGSDLFLQRDGKRRALVAQSRQMRSSAAY